jgi:hypothetical protein
MKVKCKLALIQFWKQGKEMLDYFSKSINFVIHINYLIVHKPYLC